MASDQTKGLRGCKERGRLLPALALVGLGLLRHALFLALELLRERGPEVRRLEDLADLDLAALLVGVGAALHPLDRLLLRLDLPDPVARDELLRLGERAVD